MTQATTPALMPSTLSLHARSAHSPRWTRVNAIGLPLLLFFIFTALGTLSADWLGEGYASLVFVLGITIIGAVSGLMLAVISAVVGAIVFNFFVSAPIYDISMNKLSDFAPPVVFTLCAIVSGLLSGRLKDHAARIQRSNLRLESLLEVSRGMQRAGDGAQVAAALQAAVLSRLGLRTALFRLDGEAAAPVGECPGPLWFDLAGTVIAQGVDYSALAGQLGGHLLTGAAGPIGVMVTDQPAGFAVDAGFCRALARITALALERAELASQVTSQIAEVRALERTEELKTNLLSSVSHDLRTPLTTIATAAASLATFGDRLDAETSKALLSAIVDECDRLNHLTANLLELTRLQSGASKLAWAVIPAAEMIRAMMKAMQPHAGNRRLTLTAPRDEVLIEADMVLFELALTNVLQNAIRYSADDSAIAIACRLEHGKCVIAVTDQGCGIPLAEQDKVFERFHRGAASGGAALVKGSGLGLAIAKGFVEASHGAIAVTSPVADGRGTTITIRLPLARSEAAAA